MLKFFKQNRLRKLKKQYSNLIHQAQQQSQIDRKKSDEYFVKAKEIEDKILQLKQIDE
jgi:hypothetical protein